MQIMAHSPETLARPRIRNCLKLRACLIWPNTGSESDGGAFNNWDNNGQQHAFYLTGAGGVPEPATWGLMLTGFGLAGSALRRRRAMDAA